MAHELNQKAAVGDERSLLSDVGSETSGDQLLSIGGRESKAVLSVDMQIPPLRSVTEERLDLPEGGVQLVATGR